MRVRKSEFVEVVDMCNAKVERTCEDDVLGCDFRQKMQGDDHRAEENFFRDWTLQDRC